MVINDLCELYKITDNKWIIHYAYAKCGYNYQTTSKVLKIASNEFSLLDRELIDNIIKYRQEEINGTD